MEKQPSFMTFPSLFPIKIMGKNEPNLKDEIIDIIRQHFPDTQDKDIHCKESKKGNYLAISAILFIKDQPTLDALYQELTKHPLIKMVL